MELVKLEMTPKERKIAYARGEEVDRIPTSLSAGETAPPLYGISIRAIIFQQMPWWKLKAVWQKTFRRIIWGWDWDFGRW